MYIVGKQVAVKVTQIARTRRIDKLFCFPTTGLDEGTCWWIIETVPRARSACSLLGFFTVDPEPAAGLLHGGRTGLVVAGLE